MNEKNDYFVVVIVAVAAAAVDDDDGVGDVYGDELFLK